MKKLICLLSLYLLTSCMKTEVIEAPMTKSIDTTVVKMQRPEPPQPPRDTARIPIEFDVSVEGWNELIIEH